MTFTHLLVPLDGSRRSDAVLPIASLLAHTDRARITLLRITTPDDRTQATVALDRAASTLRSGGVQVEIAVRGGDPADAIVDFAQQESVDLILMATRARTGVARTLLGSVADAVMEHSRLPLLLLHPDEHEVRTLRTILVPVDGTPGGAVALMTAAPLARASGAKLVLARATVPLPLWLYDPTLGLDTGLLLDSSWDEQARLAAESYADGLAGKLRHAGWSAQGVGVSGQPGPALAYLAQQIGADLIVMSTSAMTGAIRAVLGSVAGDVVREAHRPVLLVRRTHIPSDNSHATVYQPSTAGYLPGVAGVQA